MPTRIIKIKGILMVYKVFTIVPFKIKHNNLDAKTKGTK